MADRADYGMDERDATDTDDKWLEVDSSFSGVLENPVNHVLASFRKEYVKTERVGYELFNQVKNLLVAYNTQITNYPHYAEMQIVREMDTILDRYKSWVTSMRQNAFLGKEKMIEVQKVIDEQYVPKKEYDEMVAQYQALIAESESGWYEGVCTNYSGGSKKVNIPLHVKEITIGDNVLFKKGQGRVEAPQESGGAEE